MDDMSARLTHLGQKVAEVSDQAAAPDAVAMARRRLLSTSPSEEGRPFHSRVRRAFAAGLALAVAAAVILFFALRPAAVSFRVGSPPTAGVIGEWIAASSDASLPLDFSEGSSLVLAPRARVRVTEASASGADVLIERGAVRAKIEHTGGDTRWRLRAGPFEVRVVGTIFDARWDPETETFELAMESGSVVVNGPFLPSERVVVAGEHLMVSIRDKRMDLRNAPIDAPQRSEREPGAEADAATLPPEAPDEPAAPEPSASGAQAPQPGASESAAQRNESGWQMLAAAGRYKEALDAAERAGFSAEVGRASASELFALADAARLAGSPARAREALLAARRRFGSRGRSAFLLGKIAADQQGAYSEAVTWFETYLREEPGGSLAEQALGRILEIRRRTDPEGARAVAERYLASYPRGAYATVAKSVLSR